jgi:Ser/Thr protein kinase RdoA (MazF antagonist)
MVDADERRAGERILASAWGGPVVVERAEVLAGRDHVVRLTTGDGRTAILKRDRAEDDRGRWGDELDALATEWAALDLLAAMPEPVAPRLLGGDAERRLLLIEELPPGRLLAQSLLGSDADTARADLVAYAEALADLGAWTHGRAAEHAAARRRRGLDPGGRTWWVDAIDRARPAFLAAVEARGLPTGGVDAELAEISGVLDGGTVAGLVHGDPCPDNVVVVDGRCRLLDFERSSWGSIVLDAAYLIAPFPSCWCFAGLPAGVAGAALAAYRSRLAAAGMGVDALGPDGDGDRAVAAAVAGWLVVRGEAIARLWQADGGERWGTTTMQPRLRAWLASYLAAPGAAAFPAFSRLVAALADQVAEGGHERPVPTYPAFAGAGTPTVSPPGEWDL